MTPIQLTINGEAHRLWVGDDDLLLDVLCGQPGCTSPREGCGVGACGACTVLVAGRSVSSCLARAVQFDGAQITTADGLPDGDPVVAAFAAEQAVQCGYCIPGFVLMTHELLADDPSPGTEAISRHFAGNVCRCGCYPEIRRAVARAAGLARGAGQPPGCQPGPAGGGRATAC